MPTVQQGVELFAMGFDFICYSGDIWVLYNTVTEVVTELHAKCKDKSKSTRR